MSTHEAATWLHSNQYTEAACEHCQGYVSHASWCITRNRDVRYAYEAVLNADRLTEGDKLILHALGVSWRNNPYLDGVHSTRRPQ